jgi:hypothetical protein
MAFTIRQFLRQSFCGRRRRFPAMGSAPRERGRRPLLGERAGKSAPLCALADARRFSVDAVAMPVGRAVRGAACPLRVQHRASRRWRLVHLGGQMVCRRIVGGRDIEPRTLRSCRRRGLPHLSAFRYCKALRLLIKLQYYSAML